MDLAVNLFYLGKLFMTKQLPKMALPYFVEAQSIILANTQLQHQLHSVDSLEISLELGSTYSARVSSKRKLKYESKAAECYDRALAEAKSRNANNNGNDINSNNFYAKQLCRVLDATFKFSDWTNAAKYARVQVDYYSTTFSPEQLAHNPDNFCAYLRLADALRNANKLTAALQAYRCALQVDLSASNDYCNQQLWISGQARYKSAQKKAKKRKKKSYVD